MRILIVTQLEHLYLPESFASVCREVGSDVCAIVALPAMSTHGGAITGALKHVQLFGIAGTAIMVLRIIKAKLLSALTTPGPHHKMYSIRHVASAFNISYYEIERMDSDDFSQIVDDQKPDILISISCPQIIRKHQREKFPKGCINVHGAPLPKYRGLMPAFWALRNGENQTAATVHDLAAKLDDGDILLQQAVKIEPDDTWDSLVRKTKAAGAQALVEAVKRIKDGSIERKPNREEDATYFSFPTAKDRKAFLKAGRRFF